MVRVNLFEGSRRIALLLKLAWVIGVALVAFTTKPSVYLHFVTRSPDDAFHLTEDDCSTATDGMEFVNREVDGKTISAQLCFKAQHFESNQTMLVPFKIENDSMWGKGPYSAEVQAYTDARAQRFTFSEADRRAALEQWREQAWTNAKNAVLAAIGGWIALSVIQAVIGWIVRGFLGIRRGEDERRPPRANVTAAQ